MKPLAHPWLLRTVYTGNGEGYGIFGLPGQESEKSSPYGCGYGYWADVGGNGMGSGTYAREARMSQRPCPAVYHYDTTITLLCWVIANE